MKLPTFHRRQNMPAVEGFRGLRFTHVSFPIVGCNDNAQLFQNRDILVLFDCRIKSEGNNVVYYLKDRVFPVSLEVQSSLRAKMIISREGRKKIGNTGIYRRAAWMIYEQSLNEARKFLTTSWVAYEAMTIPT
ncbi:MAG: hypothetical protein B6240_01895 [Desulfobacteraceae bacterium 4572_87]|nr:MAG: hypothetical protein B6240_01895 [Desulfobacteraceae bacterium 4572_87]